MLNKEKQTVETREHWSSNWGFLMASIGSAIGLGNIWKFSYVTGINGGGAFVLTYIICSLIIGIPLVICETAMGRAAQRNPMGAFVKLSPHKSILAKGIGCFAILIGILLIAFSAYGHGVLLIILGLAIMRFGWAFPGALSGAIIIIMIMAVYSVVGGWTFIYAYKSFTRELMNATTPEVANSTFDNIITGGLKNNLWPVLIGQFSFVLISAYIVQCGIKRGIERYAKILMPVLFGLILILILRGITLPGALEGVRFFLAFERDNFTARSVLEAIGMAFFSLSIGMGILTTFGSYMKTDQSIIKNSFAIVGLDTLAAILSGLAIFPAVFAIGFQPDSGTGLVFKILPATFNMIPGHLGWLWSGIFFIMVSIAAITSAVGLMETACSVFIDELKMCRFWATLSVVTPILLLGTVCTFSVANWDQIMPIKNWFLAVFGQIPASFFIMLDGFTTNWVLPISGLLVAVFVGWVWGPRQALKEIRKSSDDSIDTNIFILLSGLKGEPGYDNNTSKKFTPAITWGIIIRFIAPIGILCAFLYSIGVV